MKKGTSSYNKTNTAARASTGKQNTDTTKMANGIQGSDKKENKNRSHSSLLEKLFVDLLKDTYWVEKHLVDALATMQKAATTNELQDAFEDHRFATQKHVSRLDKVFTMLGQKAEEKKCDAMEGIIKEAESMTKETKEGSMTRDVSLIISAQKAEHYEIASYGSLVQLALTLGLDNVASLLERTLWEEEDTDKLLTNIAETHVNPLADEREGKEEESELLVN